MLWILKIYFFIITDAVEGEVFPCSKCCEEFKFSCRKPHSVGEAENPRRIANYISNIPRTGIIK